MYTKQSAMRTQSGLSFMGLIIVLVVLIFTALLAFKVVPPYMEFATAKNTITIIARENSSASVAQIKRAWQLRTAVDDIKAISADDLEITKDGNEVVISFAYKKEIPLFWTVGLYINFAASSKD